MNNGRLEITTHIGCPIDCLDCPQALLRSRYKGKKDMDLDDFKAAIDKVPAGTRIDFSGMCEPFANRSCTDMILYAAEKGFPLALYTTLQGSTMEDYERLRHIAFEICVIHLPDREGRSHFNITEEYLDVLGAWNCNAYSLHGQIDERVIHYIRQRPFITYMHDRAGNVKERPHVNLSTNTRLSCTTSGRDMNHNVLLPDGTVITCCMDYGMTGVFGNLFTQTYDEVLNSDEARRMRSTLDGGESICRHCTNARLI